MSELKHTWSSDAFDAIAILAIDGHFEIVGTDADQVELEAELDKRAARDLPLEPASRWLQLNSWQHDDEAQFTLRLPKRKNWVVDVSAARGDVHVTGIQARLRVMVGKGEVEIEDCRGIFNLASGKGEIQMQRCVEAEMPERPPLPEANFQSAHTPEPPPAPETPPLPGGPGMAGEFHAHFGHGPRMRHRTRPDVSWDWAGLDSEEWAEWGTRLGEQARVWAQQFAGQFVGAVDWLPGKAGVGVKIGKGDARLEEIEAKTCAVKLASGDVKLKSGRIEELEVGVSHGDVECDSVMPAGDWEIEIKNGRIQLELPANTQARLDVATRHGDIDSQVPLVRVGRPGPEARYGGRMVGTVGQPGQDVAALTLTAVHGDIEIRLQPDQSRFTPKQTSEAPNARPEKAQADPSGVSSSQAAAASATPTSPVAKASEVTAAPDMQDTRQAAPTYTSQLAILQALSAGKISVEEAEKLLKSLEPSSGERKNAWGTVKDIFHV